MEKTGWIKLALTICGFAVILTVIAVFGKEAGGDSGVAGSANRKESGTADDGDAASGSFFNAAATDGGSGGSSIPEEAKAGGADFGGGNVSPAAALDAIAEYERSRGFMPGMGLAESTLRENSGDYAGAVIAAFKELQWAYAYGGETPNEKTGERQPMTHEAVRRGLEKIQTLYANPRELPDVAASDKKQALDACAAAIDFVDGRYARAGAALEKLFRTSGDPDDFSRWMRLVCALESIGEDNTGAEARARKAEYGAIRARYNIFPAYWYFGARSAAGQVEADFAERCIDLSPDGPYSKEARAMLAVYAGLPPSDGAAMRTRAEIEQTITDAVKNAEPGRLSALLPLASLGDNGWTSYAAGAMRALAANESFRAWFNEQREQAQKGKSIRLAERLNYIVRG
ncbi:MAG: hypothetical protein LBD20_04355 [Spirochaetaceae bacterium]|nr:hypothetical protein [Spirochaetaceae bacterium]